MIPPRIVRVRAALAHLRREPSHASELVSQLVLGEEGRVLEEFGGWLRIAGADDYVGWVHGGSVTDHVPHVAGDELVWTRRDGVLRESAQPDAAPVCDLVLGARVRASTNGAPASSSSTAGGAAPAHVVLPGGSEAWTDGAGWLPAHSLATRYPLAARAVTATALELRGVPYLWGGTSSKAFDCSGFVQRVLGLHGVALPRDAWQQAEVGREVTVGEDGAGLEPGDLLFFSETGRRVSHVAIALGERGRFVHSSTRHAGVGVDSLAPDDPLYAEALAATRSSVKRVLPEPPPSAARR